MTSGIDFALDEDQAVAGFALVLRQRRDVTDDTRPVHCRFQLRLRHGQPEPGDQGQRTERSSAQ